MNDGSPMSDKKDRDKTQHTTNVVGNVESVYNISEVHGGVNVTTSASPDCRELILQILGNTFRRAFHFNFAFRFVQTDEFNEVTQSIRDCRIFLQSNIVRVSATCPKELSDIVRTMLHQVQLMEEIFRKMQPFLNTYARIDHSTPSEMMDVFIEMETIRVEFLINTKLLSEKSNVPLPAHPDGGVVCGLDGFLYFIKDKSLAETSVKSLADALKEWRLRMKPSENQ